MRTKEEQRETLPTGKTDYSTHFKLAKIKIRKRRRRIAFKGIINQEPEKPVKQ